MHEQRFQELKQKLAEVQDLGRTLSVLGWDQRTMMPPTGAAARADQMATLSRMAHELFTSDEIGRLLDELRPYEESLPFESDEASLVRVVRRDWEKARQVPSELRGAMSRAASVALPVWDEAKRTSDFRLFLPHLRENVDLRRRYVDCFEGFDEPYDALLDDFEPGMKTAEVREVFERLKEGQVPLIEAVAGRADAVDDSFLRGRFPLAGQQSFELAVLERFGFTRTSWRLDPTPHPFASSVGTQDIRITTHYHEDDLAALFASMHEFGHGLYEHQVSPSLDRTPLSRGASLGLHESQSRMWENLIGRSRPFWRRFFPLVQETFPEQLAGADAEAMYRAVNRVQPSLIRIHADEATYNLHVILRFELEQEILAGSVDLADLPEVWNGRIRDYLGLDVPDDAQGVLQDMHWAGGHIGYFSTYALGNVVSAQLWERMRAEMPDMDDAIEAGEFGAIREWLAENVHRHGRKFSPRELLERVVGGPIDAEPYLRYLRGKVGELYGLQPVG